jgi:hypothetical protein
MYGCWVSQKGQNRPPRFLKQTNRPPEKGNRKMNSRRFAFTVSAILFFTIVPYVQVKFVVLISVVFFLFLSLFHFWETKRRLSKWVFRKNFFFFFVGCRRATQQMKCLNGASNPRRRFQLRSKPSRSKLGKP